MARRPICVPCRREMRCRKNDYMFSDADLSYVWAGDMFECEGCKTQIVVGFASQPVAWEHEGERFRTYRNEVELVLDR